MMTQHIRMRLDNKGRGDFRADGGTIWVYDAIASDDDEAFYFGGISPRQFISELNGIDGPVTLRINSPGGSVFGAQAMVAAMRAHPHPITAQIDSLAASAASVIAANCASCVMVPGSMQMIHRAWGLAIGNCEEMRATSDLLEKIDGLIADAYAAKAGEITDRETFVQMMADETWLTPEEALAVGLCDMVAGENTQRAANRWNLSAFAKAPALPVEETAPAQIVPQPKDLTADRARKLAARLVANRF